MSRTSRRNLIKVATQATQLALAAPQVVGHRVTQMMAAGASPKAHDLREWRLMSSEKTAAFTESWMAMGIGIMRANQQLALTMMTFSWNAWFSLAGMSRHSRQLQSAALGVAAQGIAPVHRTVLANAKRLASIKR